MEEEKKDDLLILHLKLMINEIQLLRKEIENKNSFSQPLMIKYDLGTTTSSSLSNYKSYMKKCRRCKQERYFSEGLKSSEVSICVLCQEELMEEYESSDEDTK